MKLRIRLLILGLVSLIILQASTSSDAEKLYKAGQWQEAEVLYQKLLKSAPSNRVYNHRYGVCLLEQNKDLAKAEKHLLNAKKRGITLSNFYLGRVAFQLYKFDDALDYYSTYAKKSTDAERKAFAKAQLEQCEQAESMLKRTEDVKILDRVMVDRNSFFKHYKLSQETGTLLENPQLINEDSICDDCTIYMTERKDRTFFSDNNDSTDIDLFYKNKLLDQWSDKVSLGSSVNTPYDEAYPFLMSDGVVLYFSSKGHNSLGGYDIYVTRFNASQNAFLPPQQLGMPFNSPGDDMLFVIDEYRNIGWFASDRSCPKGKVYVYTFVPNATITLLNTEDKAALRRAAMISEIDSDSTKIPYIPEQGLEEGKNTKAMPRHEIYFVLNDTLIYSDINDFMSDDAQALYEEYEAAEAAFDSVNTAMDAKRLSFSKTVDPQDKSHLISSIVKLEKRQLQLGQQRDDLLQSVRRLELETIRLNGGYKKAKPKEVSAPAPKRKAVEERHISPWETAPATLAKDSVKDAYFYNKALLSYYRQIYTPNAVEQLIEANRLRIKASDKLLMADYVMKEYAKPKPEEGFFESIFAYDSSFTQEVSYDQMVKKITGYRNEASEMMIKSSLNSYYAMHGQNVLLLETVSEEKVREQMEGAMNNATFAMQEAKQQLYVSDNILTEQAEKRSRGNGLLRKSIQYQEAASMLYLQYRYEKAQRLKAEKPKAIEEKVEEVKEETKPQVERQEKQKKTLTETSLSPKEEYRIQFGLFSRILSDSETDLPEISYYQYSEKLFYKYYTGHFTTRIDAAMALETIKKKGYKDAFIVKFVNGKPE